MDVIALNQIDPARIPDSVCARLCLGAAQMSMRHKDDPGREERYQKWLAERKSQKGGNRERSTQQRQCS